MDWSQLAEIKSNGGIFVSSKRGISSPIEQISTLKNDLNHGICYCKLIILKECERLVVAYHRVLF